MTRSNPKTQLLKLTIKGIALLLLLYIPSNSFPQESRSKTVFSFNKTEVNIGLLKNKANLDASIVLKAIPRGMFIDGDMDAEKLIVWEPNVSCTFRYGRTPGNRQLANYPDVLTAKGTGELTLNPWNEGLRTGIYYCILVSENNSADTSVEFKVFVQASVTAVMKSPLGSINLQKGAPLFRWDPVEGVPYYFLLLSEGQLSLVKDETGKVTGISGLNLTWQAITPTSFLKYGDPDPGGNFVNAHVPPLLPGIKYNWIILNSYAPGPDFISGKVAPVAPSEFQISRPTLSQAPTLIQPGPDAFLISDQITFEWSPVPGVSRYRFFLYETTKFQGNTIDYVLWSQVTSNNQIHLEAKSLLVKTGYRWRVVAETKEGISASGRRPFQYDGPAGWVKFIVSSEEGLLRRVSLKIKTRADASILLPAVTDTIGISKVALPVGDYSFRASKPGFKTTPSSTFTVLDGDILNIPVRVERGKSTISGQIVDDSGIEIFNAIVELQSGNNFESMNTDQTGFFSFVVQAGNWSLRSNKSGYITSGVQNITLQEEETFEVGKVVLQTANNDITGSVTFASDNKPLPGAFVRARKDDIVYKTTTSNRGTFKFSLGPGKWEIFVDPQSFFATPPSYSFALSEHGQVSATFKLFSGGMVSGSISFKGRRVEGATIKAFNKRTNDLFQSATSNLQGFYSLGLPAGEFWLEASSQNFLQRRKLISVSVGQTVNENFALTEAGFVSGTVQDQETGNLIEGARIFIVEDTTLTTFSDSDGKYLLGVFPDTPLQIDASLPGFSSVDGPYPVKASVGETITQPISLVALSGTINGRVTDGVLPVQGAEVEIEQLNLIITTDPSGRFELEGFPGIYNINISKDCHISTSQTVAILAGVNREENFNLQALKSIITGNVKDLAGVSIENALVEAAETASPDSIFSEMTGPDGNYKICLNSGIYQIKASQAGYLPASTTVVISEGDSLGGINFTLQGNFASVSGSVTDTSSTLVSFAVVALTNEVQTLVDTADVNGSFEFSKIIPGISNLQAIKVGFYGEKTAVFLAGQEQASQDLVLYPADGFIRGTVRDLQNNSGVPGVRISALLSEGGPFFETTTDGSGAYNFATLPVISGRTYKLLAFKDEYFSPMPINDVAANSAGVDFTLVKRTGIISGTVLEEETSKPIEFAKIEAFASSGSRSSTFTDSLGKYEISNLIPTEIYTLTTSKAGFFTVINDNIAAGDTSIVTILSRRFGFVKGAVVDSSGQPMVNIPIRARPLGQEGKDNLAMTNAAGEYLLRLIADFYSIKPDITHHLSDPDSVQQEVTEVDTVAGVNFTLETQTVQSIRVLRIDSENPDFSNQEQPRFEAIARDINGNEVNIGRPQWSLNVSQNAASIDSTGQVSIDRNYFGNLIITATDPLSKKKGSITPIPNVFAPVDSTTEIVLFDDRGLQMEISKNTVLTRTELAVAKTPLAPVKRGRAEIFTADSSYFLKPKNLEFNRPVKLKLLPPLNSRGQIGFIGKWNTELGIWDRLGSVDTKINPNNPLEAEITETGEYIAISMSRPIAIENLSLLPNPFSPFQENEGRQGLRIEFDLSSTTAPNPLFTLKIYNLEGNLVRLLHDQTPFSRGHSAIYWDGKTDNGTMARNGRYMIRLIIEDPSGQKNVMKSVVLIK